MINQETKKRKLKTICLNGRFPIQHHITGIVLQLQQHNVYNKAIKEGD